MGYSRGATAYTTSGVDQATGTAYVIVDGTYCGPNCTGMLIPHRCRRGQAELPTWKDHNAWRVRARVEHTFHMKAWKILRDCRRCDTGVHTAALDIARMHNLTWGS